MTCFVMCITLTSKCSIIALSKGENYERNNSKKFVKKACTRCKEQTEKLQLSKQGRKANNKKKSGFSKSYQNGDGK